MTIIRNSALALALTLGVSSVALADSTENPWYQDQNAGSYVAHTSSIQVVDNGDQFLSPLEGDDIANFATAAGPIDKQGGADMELVHN